MKKWKFLLLMFSSLALLAFSSFSVLHFATTKEHRKTSEISCEFSKQMMTYGESVRISGRLTDPSTGEGLQRTISITYSEDNGTTWRQLKEVSNELEERLEKGNDIRTDMTGHYGPYTWKPFHMPHSLLLKAFYEGDEEFSAAESPIKSLTVDLLDPPVEILNHRSYARSGEIALWIVGEAHNVGTTNLEWVKLSLVYYDSSGTMIGTDRCSIQLRMISQGQRAPFITFAGASHMNPIDASSIASYEVAVRSYSSTKIEVYEGLIAESEEAFFDKQGNYHVSGVIKNNGDILVESVVALVSFYDSHDRLADAWLDLPYPSELSSNQTTTFNIELDKSRLDAVGEIDHYSLQFDYYVERTSSTISCSVSSTLEREIVTVSGFITPTPGNVFVDLNFTKPDDTTSIVAVETTPGRFYNYTFNPKEPGVWGVRASWLGQLDIEGATSVSANFTIEEVYTLNVNTVGNGAVAKDPDEATYHYGDVVELTASADPDWEFTGWSGDFEGASNTESITIDGDKMVTATFVEVTLTKVNWTIAASAGEGGSIDQSGSVVVSDGGYLAFTFEADPGYHILDVVVDTVSEGPIDLYEFTGVATDHAIEVLFDLDEYTLNVKTVGNGAVAKDPDEATYHYGDVVELTASADPDWEFTGWSGDFEGASNTESITIDGDKMVTATFTDITWTIERALKTSMRETPTPLTAVVATFVGVAGPAGITAMMGLGGLGQYFNVILSKLPDWLKEMLQSEIKRSLPVQLKDVQKESLLTRGKMVVAGFSILITAIVYGYVEANGFPSFLHPQVLFVVIPVTLLSAGTIMIAGLLTELLIMKKFEMRGELKVWLHGLVAFLVSGFLLKWPLSTPVRYILQEEDGVSEKTKVLSIILDKLMTLPLLLAFSTSIMLGLRRVGDIGMLMCLTGTFYSLIPLKPLAGKEIFNYNRKIWLFIFVPITILYYTWVLHLLPWTVYFAAGLISALVSVIIILQYRK